MTIKELLAQLHTLEHALVVIDGPCGSGKTTLAEHLITQCPGYTLVHMDDYYIPFREKTTERLSIPGGNADSERLISEVIKPWLHGERALVRPYRVHTDTFLSPYEVPAGGSILLEGSYSGLPCLSTHAVMKLFVQVDPVTQRNRLYHRNPATYSLFLEKWIPLENHYFSYYGLPDASWNVLPGDRMI